MNTRNMCSHTVMTMAWAPQRWISRMMPERHLLARGR